MSKIIDPKTFWRLIGERATGATVVTARGVDGPAGFLGLSAAHVCVDPPTMLVSIDARTAALAAVLHGKHFAINYLPREAQAIADTFGGKTGAKGAERFQPGLWGVLTTGAPIFNDALAAIDCSLEKAVEHGAATIAIGRVVDYATRDDGEPLIFFRGRYQD